MKQRIDGAPPRREAKARASAGRDDGKRAGLSLRSRAAVVACALVIAATAPAFAVSTVGQDPPRRDEFGVIPEDAVDKDLTLPDPILDRTWPGPRPGDKAAPPQEIAPDEDETDPFEDDVVPVPQPKAPPADDGEAPRRPTRPLVGPDGKFDTGSPLPQADPVEPDAIEPEIDEPSELEDDSRPSPLDRDDDEFHQETDDPGEW